MMRRNPNRLRLTLLGVVLFLAAFFQTLNVARAQSCGLRLNVVAALQDQYGERPVYMAMAKDGRVIELWAHPDGAWTLLTTSPQGHACIQASGDREALPQRDPA
jgi:hypothetical protein